MVAMVTIYKMIKCYQKERKAITDRKTRQEGREKGNTNTQDGGNVLIQAAITIWENNTTSWSLKYLKCSECIFCSINKD